MAQPGAKQRVIVITGPTASGKTELAIGVAAALNGSVVSADSRQVYAGMNIGTAKAEFAWSDETHEYTTADETHPLPPLSGRDDTFSPDKGRQRGVLHFLLNIRRPDQPLSLSEWQTAAFAAIDKIHEAGKPAVLAGGTMLYIDSIVKNYDVPTVEPNEALRASNQKIEARKLYAELIQKDPSAAEFIQPANQRRIIRALEVIAATGRPFSIQRQQRPPRYAVTMIGLFDSWEALAQRIAARVRSMLNNGLIEETGRLVNRYGADLPLLLTMNYKQALAVIQNKLTTKEALDDMCRANMRYARRQMSWWKNRKDIRWFTKPDDERILTYLQS